MILRCCVLAIGLVACQCFGGRVEALEFPPWLKTRRPPPPTTASSQQVQLPVYDGRIHAVNEIWLSLTNYGQIGAWRGLEPICCITDPRYDRRELGISWIPSCEYPPRSQNDYLSAMLLDVGGIRSLDTLLTWSWVSHQRLIESSALRSWGAYDPAAHADQEYYAVYDDTSAILDRYSRYDYYENRYYPATELEIHQKSYAWSMPFTKRFILFDFWIKNIGTHTLDECVAGLEVYPGIINDVHWEPFEHPGYSICGLVGETPGVVEGTYDTLNIAWVADQDGDPIEGKFWPVSPTAALGVRILRTPNDAPISYNWWSNLWGARDDDWPLLLEWGPRLRRNPALYGKSAAGPEGRRATYRMLRNGESDYDKLHSLFDYQAEGWYPPPASHGRDMVRQSGSQFILSTGPFGPLLPGDSLPFTLAVIIGKEFHQMPSNFFRNLDPYNPQPFIDNLHFDDLIESARWAGWMFDTPGYDSDGDGYRGRAHLINCIGDRCDSIFYTGDGVPDLRGPGPPYAPEFTLTSGPGYITLRWSGADTELDIDHMSGQRDFEGYRIFSGRFPTDDQFSLLASWDREDFERLAWNPDTKSWQVISYPRSTPEWKWIMRDAGFDPLHYTPGNLAEAYIDTVLDTLRNRRGDITHITPRIRYTSWRAHEYNRGNAYEENGYPVTNLIRRVASRDTIIDGDSLSYGVYETVIDHLNPAVPLYFAISAFDFGDYRVGLNSLESSPSNNFDYAHPIYSAGVVVDSGLQVSVYPNPYRVLYPDAHGRSTTYYREGYEGRGVHEFEEQDRRVWFVNLPEKATIRIFSLDGDLIREIHHPDPFLTKYSSAVGWDLVSRNVQAVTSGIYIWRVDSELGAQTGKLVIIK
ncbi:MAG: hypothetical protein AB1752_03440 [Candidatus Zixiibacteriota bacterium]